VLGIQPNLPGLNCDKPITPELAPFILLTKVYEYTSEGPRDR